MYGDKKMDFFEKLSSNKIMKSVEVVPPKLSMISAQIDQLRLVSDLLDFVTVTDNARGTATINSIAYAHILKKELDLAVIPHITPRDRNLLALKSDIYAALMLDVDAFFAVGGDSIKEVKEVRELDTLSLISLIQEILSEHSLRKPVGASMFHSYSREKIIEKNMHGSDFFITQGIMELNDNMNALISEFGKLTVAGFIIPKSKSFLQNYRSLGIDISAPYLDRFLNAPDFQAETIRSIIDIYDEIKDKILGVHIMPINNFKEAKSLLEVL